TSVSMVNKLNLSGNLTNSGTLNVQPAANALASLSATNIINNYGATIHSTVPLQLSAAMNVVNAGRISSAGSLTVTAGNSIINALPSGAAGSAPTMTAAGN